MNKDNVIARLTEELGPNKIVEHMINEKNNGVMIPAFNIRNSTSLSDDEIEMIKKHAVNVVEMDDPDVIVRKVIFPVEY